MSWLARSLGKFLIRFVAVAGGLQAFNYVTGGDDAYKAAALANQGAIVIGIVVCAIANLMYDWLQSNEP